jgi:hypothetical protein
MPQITRFDIEEWIKTVPTGEFHYKEVLNGAVSPESLGKLRKIMHDISHAKEPICEPVGRRDGFYRPIQDSVLPLDWQSKQTKVDSGLILPFNIREYVFIYPKTVSVIAGSKSSGKTGFLYRTVVLNMNKMHTVLLSNMEGGVEQLHDRFCAITDIEIPNPAPFTVLPVMDNYHDFIKEPQTLYVVDYIDVPESMEFYMIGASITKIRKKLATLDGSIAVVGLQKPASRDTAYGGEQTLKDSTLYLAMNSGKLKIVDAKVPTKKGIHPKNMQWSFTYDDEGTNFKNIERCVESELDF